MIYRNNGLKVATIENGAKNCVQQCRLLKSQLPQKKILIKNLLLIFCNLKSACFDNIHYYNARYLFTNGHLLIVNIY